MTNECPPECQLDRDNLKEDVRELFGRTIPRRVQMGIYTILVSLIGTIFILIASSYLYATETYATKIEVREIKVDLKEQMDSGFAQILKAIKDSKSE